MRKLPLFVCTVLAGMLLAGWDARALQIGGGMSASDTSQLYNYSLSMEKIQKTAEATSALTKLGKEHPELNDSQDTKSIDETVQKLEKYPQAVAAIRSSGLTPHEYVVCLMTMIQATMAVGLKKSGTYKDYPPAMLKVVSKANLDYTEQHWDEIQKMIQSASSD